MNTLSSLAAPRKQVRSHLPFAWLSLLAITAIAIGARVLFFTGFFGSDDVSYARSAIEIANGVWKTYSYAGSWRYGVNLPNALFVYLLDVSEYSVNLWSLICSVAEVGLVFHFTRRLWNTKTGLIAATLIALLPLHVHLAGVMRPDAPLALFITLSFYAFWEGERRQHAGWYFCAGLAIGYVYWIKESVPIYSCVILAYALSQRTWKHKWLWTAAGMVLVVCANFALQWEITGDPLHMLRVMYTTRAAYTEVLTQGNTSPWYYFYYMFVDIKHVWIMPYLALASLVVILNEVRLHRSVDRDLSFVVIWGIGLLALFSFLPLSINPLLLITKQTNYMAIFMAPLCLLAARLLSTLRSGWLIAWLVTYSLGAIILSGLEQQVVHVFTANSKAAVAYADSEGDIPVFGMTNARNASAFSRLMQNNLDGRETIHDIAALLASKHARSREVPASSPPVVAHVIVDLQTASWGSNAITKVSEVPECWQRISDLKISQPFGYGRYAVAAVTAASLILPNPIRAKLEQLIEASFKPQPAYVYVVPAACGFSRPAPWTNP